MYIYLNFLVSNFQFNNNINNNITNNNDNNKNNRDDIDNNLDINARQEFLKKSADYKRYMKLPSMQINFIIIIFIVIYCYY